MKKDEYSKAYGKMRDIINGDQIKHLQFSEFSEGHGSIYGTLVDGKKFKIHISELLKMMDEFDFSVYDGSGNVLNATLKVNWKSTNKLRETADFKFKSKSYEYNKEGNLPTQVNYVVRDGKGEDAKFIAHRTGPYYSGQLVITNPEDVKDVF